LQRLFYVGGQNQLPIVSISVSVRVSVLQLFVQQLFFLDREMEYGITVSFA
jgi:hypothetical protein